MRYPFLIERVFCPMPHDELPLALQSRRIQEEFFDVWRQLARTLSRRRLGKAVVAPFYQFTRNGAVRVWLATRECHSRA